MMPRGGSCIRRLGVMMLIALVMGCRPSREDVQHDSAVAAIGTVADAPRLDADTVGHGRDTTVIADPDQRLLRWMLQHHAELVYVAHQAMRHPDSLAIRELARDVDRTHDSETREMRSLLRSEFHDASAAAIRPEHAALVTPFASLSGDAYGAAFRSFLVTHHSQATQMIDSLTPQLTRPRVKSLMSQVRDSRKRDIEALQRWTATPR